MTTINPENFGVDHLYPNGVEVFEVTLNIPDIKDKIARRTALAAMTDPQIRGLGEMAGLAQLHGEGDRITDDFIKDGADDLAKAFTALQRWIVAEGSVSPYTYSRNVSIVYRWENKDTRTDESKQDYSVLTREDIRIDGGIVSKVSEYAQRAILDYVLKELYRAIGHDKKYLDYLKSYEQNRSYVRFWANSDTSYQTQYGYGGIK